MRKKICAVMAFVLVNMLCIGIMQVYKISYNTMNDEKISMADISFDEKTNKTDIEILGNIYKLDIIPEKFSGQDIYFFYAVLDNEIKEILYLINDMESLSENY
ncbi:MAG: hypothetical protein ACI4JM_05395 [Oscillospiraceae bacterium]